MDKSLRVGIIGAGWAGSGHAAAYSRMPDAAIAGLWSRGRARAERLAGQLDHSGLAVYDRWEELIERGNLDVISVATPAALRNEPVAAALERGLHVLVEKPFTADLPEARELARLADRASSVTAVSFNWRYSPGNQVARRAVQAGAIGQVLSIGTDWSFRVTGDVEAFYDANPWMTRRETGGGMIRQAGSHELDRVRFLTGLELTQVVGRLLPSTIPRTNVDECYLLLAEMSNGGLGDFRLKPTPGQWEWRTTLFGTEGTLTLTHESVVRQCRDDDEPVPLQVPEVDQVPDGVELLQHTWNRLIADFCSAIRRSDIGHKSVAHLPTFADGLRVQEFIAAAERSEAERRWVDLAEFAE